MNTDHPLTCGTTVHTITLKRRESTIGAQFRWQRQDGEWVSPIFTILQVAYYYGKHVPLITDSEWMQQELPGAVSEIQQVASLGLNTSLDQNH